MKECSQAASVAGQRFCLRMGRFLEAVGLAFRGWQRAGAAWALPVQGHVGSSFSKMQELL